MTLYSKAAIWTPTIGDAGTFVESSTAASASMAVENLQNQQPTRRWRSTDLNSAYFIMDFGGDYTVDSVLMLYTNATNQADIRVRMDGVLADVSGESADLDTGQVSHWPEYDNNGTPTLVPITGWDRTHAIVHFTATTKRYLRVDVYDSTNADGYYEAGRLYVSTIYQPTLNVEYGSSMPWPVERQARLESAGGALHPIARPRINSLSCSWQFKYEDELMEEMYELARLRGTSNDLVYCADPTSKWQHHQLVYGTMSAPTTPSIPEYGFYTLNFSMEELP